MKKNIVRTLSRAVDNIVLLTLLVCLLFAAWSLWDTHRMYEDAAPDLYEQYKPSGDNQLSFDELRAMNPDVIGWIQVYDTEIDYPILHSKEDSSYYLSRNPMKEFQATGSIYMDQNNARNFSDFNTILYGHHMSGHTMFGDLDLFRDRQFFMAHQYGDLFYSPSGEQPFVGEHHGVEFFALVKAEAYDTKLYSPGVKEISAKDAYLQHILSIAEFTRDINVTSSDRILVMSTCSEDITNGRYVLVGKILDHEVPNPFPEEEKGASSYLDFFSIFDNFMKLPVWLWILILVLVILLLGLLYYLEKRRLKKKQQKRVNANEPESSEN